MMAHVAFAIVTLKDGLGTSLGLAPHDMALPKHQSELEDTLTAYMFIVICSAIAESQRPCSSKLSS
jgi:hypothetical protein